MFLAQVKSKTLSNLRLEADQKGNYRVGKGALLKELDFGGPETFSLLLFSGKFSCFRGTRADLSGGCIYFCTKIAHGPVQNWPGYNNSITFSRDTTRVRIECATKLFIYKKKSDSSAKNINLYFFTHCLIGDSLKA